MQAAWKRLSSPRMALAALFGFIVIFSATAAGYDYFHAGTEKWGNPAWTGEKAGTGIAGFIKGANAKAAKSKENPNPEVLPAQRAINDLYLQQTPLFSWMVVLGELLMPLGILFFLVVKFPASRFFLMFIAGLAAFMNFTFLAEGTSSSNPPMVFMWLTIIWLAGLFPAGALYYAIDLRRLLGKGATEYAGAIEPTAGQWLFAAVMLVITFIAALLMYPFGEALVFLIVSALIAAALFSVNTLLARRTTQEVQTPIRTGSTQAA